MRVFMIGGKGFVGTYLAAQMIRAGYNVTILTPSLAGIGSGTRCYY